MATIRDVGRLAGVSISTVSLSLNDPSRVSAETVRKVADAARQVRYVANPLAASLKNGRSRLIGMVVSDISNPFFSMLLCEVERYALERGYMVILSDSGGDPAHERAILDHLSSQRVSGIILAPCGQDEASVAHVRNLSMPFVLFDQKIDGIESDFVGTDNALASAMLTEHLIRLGHTRIALLGGTSGLFTAEERKRGFLETMQASKAPIESHLVVDAGYGSRQGYEHAMRMLTGRERPTAIVAANNVIGLGALEAMIDLNLDCPSDVSLTWIDRIPWDNVIRPRMTMAVQPVEKMAHAASKLLIDRIGSKDHRPLDFVNAILPPALVIGASTAGSSMRRECK